LVQHSQQMRTTIITQRKFDVAAGAALARLGVGASNGGAA
jgi:hypothetical protein